MVHAVPQLIRYVLAQAPPAKASGLWGNTGFSDLLSKTFNGLLGPEDIREAELGQDRSACPPA